MKGTPFDPSAPATIAYLNKLLSRYPTTRSLSVAMTQKPYVVERFGHYVAIHTDKTSPCPILHESMNPDAVFVDGNEVVSGCSDLEDFTREVEGYISSSPSQRAA
jgi:hypothetical protein